MNQSYTPTRIRLNKTENRFFIDQIGISRVNLESSLAIIEDAFINNQYGYICVTNARTSYLANQDKEYLVIQNNSLITVPDGAPLVWIAQNSGFKEVGKVSGKDLMDAIFTISEEKGYSHYFFGSTSNTIQQLHSNLKKDYSGLEIKDAVSPPFQPLEEFDIDALAQKINELKPSFFWCGLGAPKQERLMALLQPKLKQTVCVGVGLAFEYFAETVKRAPLWMQKSGLEWFYRLSQQPNNISRAVRPLSWIAGKTIMSKF